MSAIEALPDPEPRSNGSGPITHKIVQNRLALGGEESVCGSLAVPAAGSIRRTQARFARGFFREVVPVHRLAYSFGWDPRQAALVR